jgi:hypothetical protein
MFSRLPSLVVAAAFLLLAAPSVPLPGEEVRLGWRTTWGDPDLQGIWTSDDMRGIPRERHDEFGTRPFLTAEEFARRADQDQQTLRQQLRGPYGARNDLRSRTFGQTSLIVDPPDGKLPSLTPDAVRRTTSRDRGSFGQGPFDGPEDFSLFDRCITRGVIVQAPGYVAITYEMVHDTRIIPLDGRPHPGPRIRLYMGDARGRWERDTLLIETTNFTDRTSISENGTGLRHSEQLRLTERITRVAADIVDYRVTIDDPKTYTAPWTMSLSLTSPRGYELLPYECHEGNHGLRNILSAERAEDRAADDAARRGIERPRRVRTVGTGPAAEGAER